MPRQQPRRTSYASTGSYSSFFSSGAGSSKSSPPSPTSSSSEPSSSFETGSPSPSPPKPSIQAVPVGSNSAATDQIQLSKPRPQTAASKEEIARVEQQLEEMYRATPGPVHSLKHVDKKKREKLEAEMERIGYEKTLRKWWTTKQWAERKKPVPPKSKAEPPLPLQVEEKSAKPFGTDVKGSSSNPVATPKASPVSKPKPRPTVKKKKEVVIDEPVVLEKDSKEFNRSLIPLASEPGSDLELSDVQALSSNDPGSDAPRVPSPNLQFIDPKAVTKRSNFASKPSIASPSARTPIEALHSLTAPLAHKSEEESLLSLDPHPTRREEEKDVTIELPAKTLCIGQWARRAAVDPSQLRVVYSSRSDSLVFSTQHLESIYHLHLPVASISALVLFHSLVESRSYLLIHRDCSDFPRPHFTMTSAIPTSSTSPVSSPVTLIQDFTPSQQASTSSIYGLELEGTSLIPSLLQEIDSLSPSFKLLEGGKLFVGPWQEASLLTLEDLISNCLIIQKTKKRKIGNEGERTSLQETGSYTLRYTGDDTRKKDIELWTRKWCFSKVK